MTGEFEGSYAHKLDNKGRIVLPARFREGLGQFVVATIGYGGKHVSVYPKAQWEVQKNELKAKPADNSKESVARRMLMAYSYEQEIDSVGRILIPPQLRKRVSIDQEVSVNGNVDHVEIWDMAAWDSYGCEDIDWS